MTITVPSWFKGRQCKAEELGPDLIKATGPNLPVAYLQIRRDDGAWFGGFLKYSPDGQDEAGTDFRFEAANDAWDAAFELYRQLVIC